jgi:ribonucleoside-diphosphate reductase alpha chain
MYSYDEVYSATLKYFDGDDLAANVFVTKYALKDKEGNYLEKTPDDMHKRLAREFARIEANYGGKNALSEEEIYQSFKNFKNIVPQGSPSFGIGNDHVLTSLSNCLVVRSPDDNMSSIFETGKNLANLFKARCGVGLDISTLRPEGARVSNAAGTSSGAWSFSDLYSFITRLIGQCIAVGERVLTRRGLVKIEDVLPQQDEVWTKTGWVRVNNIINNGNKDIYKITTKYGYSIKTSKDHIFLTENDGNTAEKRLKDFIVGDSIVIIPGTNTETNYIKLQDKEYVKSSYNNSNRLNEDLIVPEVFNEEISYLIGYCYGDGSIDKNKSGIKTGLCLACSNDWPLIKEKLSLVAKNQFNYKMPFRRGDGNLERLSISSRKIVEWMEYNSILKQKSFEIKTPDILWNSPQSVQCNFLAGFFDADGCAGGKKTGYVFNTVSEAFAKDTQKILMSIGIVSKLRVENRSSKGWRNLYRISITGRVSQERFVKLFKDKSIKVNSCRHISLRDNVLTPYRAKNIGVAHHNCNYVPDNNHYISANTYNRLIKENVINSGELLIKDEVKEIVHCGNEETYDLCLDKEHMFWCEGFYVHNSGRRGALMLTMDIRHPDIYKFITMKMDRTKVTGANISVRISDEFMRAVEADDNFTLKFPVDSNNPTFTQVIKAKDLWNVIVETATSCAEPGIIFWDTTTRRLPAESYADVGFKTICVNPCSEISLSEFDSCRLMSINLKNFVNNPFTDRAEFDFERFKKSCYITTRLGDDLIDLEVEKINRIIDRANDENEKSLWSLIRDKGIMGRRVGIGTHGLADALAGLCLRYDNAMEYVDRIYETLKNSIYTESIELAKERGAFPVFDWDKEKDNEFIQDLPKYIQDEIKLCGRRNIALLTCAPTGSISIESQVSSGIEPVFKNFYTRKKKINANDMIKSQDIIVDDMGDKWITFDVFHHNVKEWMHLNSKSIKELPEYFVESHDVDWAKRVELQSRAQKHIDHAISSTINLPKGTSSDLVGKIYMEAWEKGLKGITVYVDGSRSGVLVERKQKEKPEITDGRDAPKRPEELNCHIHHVSIKGQKWLILVGMLEDKPYEIFGGVEESIEIPRKYTEGLIVKVKEKNDVNHYDLHFGDGGCIKDIAKMFNNTNYQVHTRLVSLGLRHGAKPNFLVEQLLRDSDNDLTSFSRAISRVLKKYIKDGTIVASDKTCISCGQETLVYSDGCVICKSCSWTKCQ